ncbi:hypothetical protein [Pseudomonas saliphila]|uniref:hypothetical protein n=1 Tax=Pseudomonas saliphila TaxID=2586906 RepID=UPI00123A2DB9|nr:hypothetical protein [Pseudomonas saliphila]
MPEFLQSFDLGSSAIPLLVLIAGLFLIKKLLRFGLFLALLGGVALLLEHEGISVVGYIQAALSELRLDAFLDWLVNGNRM